ncbi:MAG: PAS domain-containing protein [Proteobacteria bacterium]|nr:PAS domain-containing protein [Pseudomonadota bacterium]MBU1639108.1 PAS domain-containing protein [Pseudomonadota bacterium]
MMTKGNTEELNQSGASFIEDIGKIVEVVRKPFLILEKNYTVLYANQRFYNAYQVTPEQIVGHDFFSVADKEWDFAAFRHLLEVVLAEKESTEDDYEIDHIVPRLGRKILRINGQRTFLTGIDKHVLLLSIEDYTKRKFQEQQLLESVERFQRLFETSYDGLLLVNKESGIITAVNAALAKMLGISRDEIVGKLIQEAGIVNKEADLTTLLERLSSKDFYTFDDVLINLKTSLPFPAQITFTDRSSVIQCNIRDISERIEEKQLLQKTVREWQTTFNSVPDLITVLDPDMRILRANDACNQFLAVPPGELEGRYCYEVFAELHDMCPGCPASATLRDHKLHSEVITHPGIGKKFQVTIAPIRSENKELVSLIHVARDITDIEELERQLRQAQKMEAIGTLAGGIAHDFNNILTPILGYAEIALQSIPPASPLEADLQQVLLAANRAKELVKQILSFSRQSEADLQPLKIQFVLKEALKLIRSSIPANIEIKENINPDCSAIMADPTHVHQILMNLCTNAYQAMLETGGILRVSLAEVEIGLHDLTTKFNLTPGPHVLLEVTDSGPGIPKEIIDKIFEPYFTTKGKGKGTGLGLAVVHGIVKNYKGAITVYSEPGKGSVFRIYFPSIAAESALKQSDKDSTSLPRGKERILLVDDEVMIVALLEKMLSGLGYKISGFTNCEDALAAFRTYPDNYDLIITDMTMPKITGDKLAKEILSVRPDMPIILCTGFSHMVSNENAHELGIRKYLTKPILRRDLAIAVRDVLDNKR